MGESIWCDIHIKVPKTWSEEPSFLKFWPDAEYSERTEVSNGFVWLLQGEGNYGLLDGDIEQLLGWLDEHKVPYRASSDAKYDMTSEWRIFDGTTHRSADGDGLSLSDYRQIEAYKHLWAVSVEDFYDWMNASMYDERFTIDHLPPEEPTEEDE